MNYKKLTAAITAICVLSLATGATTFAAKNVIEDKAENSIVTEETTESTEKDEEIADEEVSDEEVTEDEESADAPEAEAPEKPEKPVPPVVEDEEITEGEDGEATEDEESAEKPAKPAKKAGKKEIVDMINSTFDFETADFVDEDTKAAWFEFCLNNLDDAAPKVEKPEADTEADAEKPVKPAKKAGKKEIIEMINNTFDLEAESFISDETKAAWFEFCTELNAKPEKPVPPVVEDGEEIEKPEKPVPPVVEDGEEIVKPEKPVPPVVEDGEEAVKPEKPVPPVVEDGEEAVKPEGPAKHEKGEKPAKGHHHGHKNDQVQEDTEITDDEVVDKTVTDEVTA